MYRELVIFDLETTGLSVESDSIIEIGAVRLKDGKIVEEFSTLVNPLITLSSHITHITGIQQEDLKDAPSLRQALPEFIQFVGDATVIAHNIAFDIAFMNRFGALTSNFTMDTLELASVILPNAHRYNLGSLVDFFGIPLEQAHRALDDARATAHLYLRLWEKALELPRPLLQEIAHAGKSAGWSLTPFFQEASNYSKVQEVAPIFTDSPQHHADVAPTQLEADKQYIEHFFSKNSPLSNVIPNFEPRDPQTEMALSVFNAFTTHQHLTIEAGTGTGKSLAYLLPSAVWALTQKEKVVIATSTINLQDQLINQETKFLQQAMNTPIRVHALKGRSNYLCMRRFNLFRQNPAKSVEAVHLFTKLLFWLQSDSSGDKTSLSLRGAEYTYWNYLSAEDSRCNLQECPTSCPFYKAHHQAQQADVLVVSHALLLSDSTSETPLIPPYQQLIIDEAHQLEESITSALSIRFDLTGIQYRLQQVANIENGLLNLIFTNTLSQLSEQQTQKLKAFIQDIHLVVKDVEKQLRLLYAQINELVGDPESQTHSFYRILPKNRTAKLFQKTITLTNEFEEYLTVFNKSLGNFVTFMKRFVVPPEWLREITSTTAYFEQLLQFIKEFVITPKNDNVYWIEVNLSNQLFILGSAPISCIKAFESLFLNKKSSVILTGATLRTNGTFDYFLSRLTQQSIPTVVLPEVFDYKNAALLYIPTDIPEPKKTGYQQAVERTIVEIATALEGRTLVLFTSYAQLKETTTAVSARLALGGITIYDQITGASRDGLVSGFRSTHRAILMGTRGFWQGVDIPGDDLQAIIIVKLPFAVPTDPIFASRSETFQDSFNDYAVPDAILRFRQGFGRLIRKQTDRGIVIVLDSRIHSSRYGKQFINSLPDCTVTKSTLSNMAKTALTWLTQTNL